MRTFMPRMMLATVTASVLLPALLAPAQAAPWTVSSSSLGGSSLSSVFEELTDEEIVVDLPGYGKYRFPADLTSASLDLENASPADLFSAAVFAADYEENTAARQAAVAALDEPRRAQVAAALAALHGGIENIAPPKTASVQAPIVVLGNGLRPDGSIHPNLENRLSAAAQLAGQRPEAPIVVSGGLLADGYVEAHAMRDWLVEAGVAPGRILVEDQALSTVGNARLTRELLPAATDVIVVTSRNHVHRAVVDFTLAFGPDAWVAGVGAPNDPPTALPGVRGTYRDVMMWYLG